MFPFGSGCAKKSFSSSTTSSCDKFISSNPGYTPMTIQVPFGAGHFMQPTTYHLNNRNIPYPKLSLYSTHVPNNDNYKRPLGFDSIPQNQYYGNYQQPLGLYSHYAHYAPQYRSTSGFMRQGTPTVLPKEDFDARADSAALRKAMKGFGCDDDGLIEVLCRRSNQQRQEIKKVFKTDYGKDLIDNIKGETRGNFEDLMVALLTPTLDFYCKEIYDACAGIGTDEEVLIEVLCTLSNNEINMIKDRYQEIYGKDLENVLIGETSGNFKRMLVSLLNANRDESGVTDIDKAKEDATALLRAGELRMGTDESVFNSILCQRNYEQLKLIFNEYQTITGHSFEKAITNEFSGTDSDVKDGFLAIFHVITNKAEFFAKQVNKSMKGLGTNDRQLIRLIVTRCEIDMTEIKEAHDRLFGESLKSMIKGDTSGAYKHALYALTGEERSS